MDRDDLRLNHLLATLPRAEQEHLAPYLVQVDLQIGQVIYEPGRPLRHVFFPTTSIVSLMYVSQEGTPTEIAVAGNEGVVGVALFMGGETTAGRAIVQSAGQAYRLDARVLKNEFRRGGPLQGALLRYTQALMTQISQTAVCNQHHSIEQQLCRWILLSVDRLPSSTLTISEAMIAGMLGARRSDLVTALRALARLGLIRYGEGRIEVLDKAGLEGHACECYRVVKQEFARLLP